jgi:galactitol-specific phosphotransferase system IIC component
MKQLFTAPGPLNMSILTIILIIMVVWAIYHFFPVLTKKEFDISKTKSRLKYTTTIGSFGMVTGFLGQLIALYHAFNVIEQAGDISPSLFLSGLKMCLIPIIYGILIYLLSLLIWMAFDYHVVKKLEKK